MSMYLDIIALILILYGFYTGYSRGLIKTVFDTLSIVFAIVISLKMSPLVIQFIENTFHLSPAINVLIGFIGTFFTVLFLIRFIGKKIESILKAVHINFVNKLAGGVLMAFVFAYCFSGLIWLSEELKVLPESEKKASITYPLLKPLPELTSKVFRNIKPIFKEFWDKSLEAVDHVKEKVEE